MKELNLYTQNGKHFNYIIDEELTIGIYTTNKIENLNHNDKILKDKFAITLNEFYNISGGVLIKTKGKNNSRIDFLITEDVCFESIELICSLGSYGQFYEQFVKAFDKLETKHYDDDIWYS